MSVFRADLHIHSRFSRATSRKLTLPHLAAWAGAKGIDVLATGDFTHPVWRDELREALVLDEASGLYRLRQPLSPGDMAREIPGLAGLASAEPLFMLEAEISSIYKKNGAVRKVHSLVYVPDFAAADKLCARLDRIGNLNSDGRPILGLDVRHLLELVLEIPRAAMIPAHIWTPWFSLFGSRSGFNSLEECFEDLTPHIFALETGLSSDPDMNRCWSRLDGLKMVSNSDAHSGENLAREATLFTGAPGYDRIFDALRGKTSDYAGTLEFFPDEGKYHLDGHRDCKVVLEPEECRRLNDLCPVCGKPLTVGVLHRVLELADRQAPLEPGANFRSLVPLAEILGELFNCGPKTKKPQLKLAELTHRFGPELTLLLDTPVTDAARYWPELGEALRRMRAGQVIRQGGYDGEYGVIRLFEKNELGSALLLHAGPARKKPLPAQADWPAFQPGEPTCAVRTDSDTSGPTPPKLATSEKPSASAGFLLSQQSALEAGPYPVLVMAGPGSGKTRTLVGRITRLLGQGVPANQIVAVTFTRRAAAELRERLAASLGRKTDSLDFPEADTLHALALKYRPGPAPVVLSEEAARQAFGKANPGLDGKQADAFWDRMSLGREKMCLPDDVLAYAAAYQTWKQERGLADYTDLPETWLRALQTGQTVPWRHVMVDEVQDLSPLQRSLIQTLLPESGAGFFGIGDPDQSIYSFRGADASIGAALGVAWPTLRVLSLTESHRAPQAILDAGRSVLGRRAACADLTSVAVRPATLQWLQAPTAEREAMWMADRIAYLIGGTSHQQADIRRELAGCHLASGSCSPGDIAVLVRLKALMSPLRMALERRGIPCAVPEAEAFWVDARVDALLRGAAFFVRGTEADLAETGVHAPAEAWRAGPAAVLAAVRQVAPAMPETVFDPMFEESAAFRKLASAFRDAGNNWQDLLGFVSLRQELDLVKSRAEQVQIMTMHAAKGLEFKVVMLPCLDDGLLPFHGVDPLLKSATAAHAAGISMEDEAMFEEERRLLYVGLTRAAEAVFASSAAQRTLYGHSLRLLPSPLLPFRHFQAVHLARRTKVSASQLSFF